MNPTALRPFLALLVLASASQSIAVCAQIDETRVRLVTPDGVTLRGRFLPGTKSSPCVMLLHDLGELRHEKERHRFAEVLHKNGYAVLQFHLRGHGQSTAVDPDVFWSPPFAANRKLVKSKSKEEIEFEDFDSSYYPYLINDIAAAKAYLDRKNDAGECNSANLLLVSSGSSGALVAAWINSEMWRFRLMPAPFPGGLAQLANEPEGANILGAVFINLSPQLGKRKLAVSTALQSAVRRQKLPLLFFCGGEDMSGTTIAKDTEKLINANGKLPFTGVAELPGANALAVERRVLTDKEWEKEILRYLKQLDDERGQEWQDRDWKEAVYYWRNPSAPTSVVQANQAGNNMPAFANYGFFHTIR